MLFWKWHKLWNIISILPVNLTTVLNWIHNEIAVKSVPSSLPQWPDRTQCKKEVRNQIYQRRIRKKFFNRGGIIEKSGIQYDFLNWTEQEFEYSEQAAQGPDSSLMMEVHLMMKAESYPLNSKLISFLESETDRKGEENIRRHVNCRNKQDVCRDGDIRADAIGTCCCHCLHIRKGWYKLLQNCSKPDWYPFNPGQSPFLDPHGRHCI